MYLVLKNENIVLHCALPTLEMHMAYLEFVRLCSEKDVGSSPSPATQKPGDIEMFTYLIRNCSLLRMGNLLFCIKDKIISNVNQSVIQ